MSSDWGKRIEEIQKLRAARLAKVGNSTNVVQFPSKPEPDEGLPAELAEAIPTASFTEEEKEDVAEHIQSADQQIEALVKGIDILQAYDMWIGKMKPSPSPGSSEVFISCPLPGHEDKNPSACANTDTNLWMCYRCQQGGDILDLAAIRYDMPDYKAGQNFHNLYRKIAENDFGWTFENENGFQVGSSPEDQQKKYEAAQQQLEEQRAQLKQQQGELPPKNVIDIETGEEVIDLDDEDDYEDLPKLDWRPIVKEGTFLDEYMKSCCVDHFPEEFHFWNGLQAIGLAIGRHATINETLKPYGNLFLCHLGVPGLGKSGSVRAMEVVVREALPFDADKPDPFGAHVMSGLSSGEQLVEEFVGLHQTGPNAVPLNLGNIKGLAVYDEFTDLAGRASRLGNIIKPKLQEFYDCKDRIENRSKTGGRTIALNPFLCFSTSVQPDIIRNVLSKDDANSGFLSRFIFVTGTRKKPPAINRLSYNFDMPIMMLKLVHAWALGRDDSSLEIQGRLLDYSEEAEGPWTNFHDNVIDKLVENGPNISVRLGIAMRKLILLLSANAKEETISLDTVERAMKLWDYLVESYVAVDRRVSKSLITQAEDDILKTIRNIHINKGAGHVTVSQILEIKKRKYTRTQIEQAINTLVRLDEISEIPGSQIQGKGRKPKVAYVARSLA